MSMTTEVAKPSAAPDDEKKVGRATLSDGVEVEILGVAPIRAGKNDWFTADGKPTADPSAPFSMHQFNLEPPPTRQLVIRVRTATQAAVRVEVPHAQASAGSHAQAGGDPSDNLHIRLIALKDDANPSSADVIVSIADGEWNRLIETPIDGGWSSGTMGTERGGVAFTEMIPGEEGTAVYVATEMIDDEWRVVCMDDRGEWRQAARGGSGGRAGKISTGRFVFDLAPPEIRAFAVEFRPFQKQVTFQGVTLDPKKPTTPKVVVKDRK
jgi:hypothetical protein